MFGDALPSGGNPMSFVIPIVIVLAVILIRNRQARRLRVEALWIRPAIFIAFAVAALVAEPPFLTPVSLAILFAGLALGGLLGWQRGRLMHIEVNPETHELSSRASPWGLVFIVGLMVVRVLLHGFLLEHAREWHLPVVAVLDAFLLFVVGLFVVQGLEMSLRANRLLTEARANKAGG
jgi:hypothetical protein